MPHHPGRNRNKLTALALAMHMLTTSAYAADNMPASTEIAIQMPAQPLGQALNALASQTGWFIGVDAELVRGKQAPALQGHYSPESALRALLANSGLQYRISQGGTVAIERAAPASVAPSTRPEKRANAEQPSRHEELALDEVIVTGEKIERKLEDTLSSVVVTTAADIQAHGDQSLTDVMMRTPGVYTQSRNDNWGIRGVPVSGFDDQGPHTMNGAVSVYVDGALQAHRMVTLSPLPLWDVEQIEVYRGPQSTTQGRNALAGAVLLQTANPRFKNELSAQTNIGSYGQRGGSVMANAELVPGVAAGRITLDYQTEDGYIRNETLDKDADARRSLDLRGKLLALPTDKLEMLLSVAHTDYRMGDNAVTALNGKPLYYDMFADTESEDTMQQNAMTFTLNYYLNDDWTVTSITSATHARYHSFLDFDQTTADINGSRDEVIRSHKNRLFNQEVRLGYHTDTLRGHAGIYYGRNDKSFEDQLESDDFVALTETGKVDIENHALFGEINWDFLPRWQLIAGLRYDRERNKTDIAYPIAFIALPVSAADYNQDFNAWLPKLGLSYRLAPEHLLGAVVQRGYRGGGVNVRARTTNAPYDEEYTTNYELSYRGSWLDKKLHTFANVYYTDWRDQQVSSLNSSNQRVITNAAHSRLAGVEFNADLQATDKLRLSFGGAYNDTKYKDYVLEGADLSGQEFLFAPKYKYTLGATYRHDERLTLNVDTILQSRSVSGYETSGGEVIGKRENDRVELVNASVSYRIDKRMTLQGFVKNLFDREYITNNQADDPVDALDVGAPRTVGAVLRLDL